MNPLSLFIPSAEHERSEISSGPVREIYDSVFSELMTSDEHAFNAVENQISDHKRHAHIGVTFGRKLDALSHEELVVTEPVSTPEPAGPKVPTIAELEQAGHTDELAKKRLEVARLFNNADDDMDTNTQSLSQPQVISPRQDWTKFEATPHDPHTYPRAA